MHETVLARVSAVAIRVRLLLIMIAVTKSHSVSPQTHT
jgi:hypothetical protein